MGCVLYIRVCGYMNALVYVHIFYSILFTQAPFSSLLSQVVLYHFPVAVSLLPL